MNFILIGFSLVISTISFGQFTEVNLIITINEKVVTKGVNNPVVVYLFHNGDKIDSLKAIYSPGALKIDSASSKKINSLTFDKTEFAFTYTSFEGGGTRKICSYMTPLFNGWQQVGFIILKFYDLNISKYRKMFIDKGEYVSEMESDLVSSSALRWK
jgi:hypothetical protein